MDSGVLDKQIEYMVTLLAVSPLNVPSVRWRLQLGEPRSILVINEAAPYVYDEFQIIYSRPTKGWEVVAQRVLRSSAGSDWPEYTEREYLPVPLLTNLWLISALNSIVSKMTMKFRADAAQVVTVGTMNYDPVEGEEDYVTLSKPQIVVTVADGTPARECACTGHRCGCAAD